MNASTTITAPGVVIVALTCATLSVAPLVFVSNSANTVSPETGTLNTERSCSLTHS